MQPEIARRLLALNHQFYQTFALQFSSTRQRLQPGVRRILEGLPATARLLDLGCGNGELARALAAGGFRGLYIGLDNSQGLLDAARRTEPAPGQAGADILFLQADLSSPDWEAKLTAAWPLRFDFILAFAVLHHLPGREVRVLLLRRVRRLLAPGGRFIHSNWQFLNSARLRARVQPWERAGLQPEQVDPGDYLLDWRAGGEGLRYVHHFSEAELSDLAAETGFRVVEEFISDGQAPGLGLYQTWEIV